MPRKKRNFKRELISDPVYNDRLVSQFINVIMVDGKKGTAERALYGALDIVQKKLEKEPLDALHRAVQNVVPEVEVRSRRVGGSTYQVPTEVRADRGRSLALRWLVDASKGRSERGISNKLAGELMDAFNNRGNAIKKREDTHRMADANKAFSHFKW